MLNVILCAAIILSPATTTQDETELLARMITAEARGEPLKGQRAVAWVAVNRVQAGGWFGDNLPDVLHKPFQFVLHRHYTTQAYKVARSVLHGSGADPTDGATHFHSTLYSPPRWAKGDAFTRTATIGNHAFYRQRRAGE